MTSLVAAAVVALVLLYLTEPLQYVPVAALGAVLVKASLSLLDLQTLGRLYRLRRSEFALSILATFGVIWVGAIQAIGVAVILAVLRFVSISAKPRVDILGKIDRMSGFHSIVRYPEAETYPGLVLFRFNGPLIFFNTPYFKQRSLAAIDAAGPGLKWFVLDAIPVTQMDVTGYYELEDLAQTLHERGAELVIAGRMREVLEWHERKGLSDDYFADRHYPTLRETVRVYKELFMEIEGKSLQQ